METLMFTKINNFLSNFFLGCSLFLLTLPAYAHHPMGGTLPQSFMNGFLSGIAHPIIGFDHLAFILTFALIIVYYNSKIILTSCFVLFSLIGTLLSINYFILPMPEILISISIIIAGFIVIKERKVSFYFPILLAIISGLFHGYAFGQTVTGIEQSPLIAYLAGIAGIETILILGTSYLISNYYLLSLKPKFAGAIFTGVGLTFFIENIEKLI